MAILPILIDLGEIVMVVPLILLAVIIAPYTEKSSEIVDGIVVWLVVFTSLNCGIDPR